MIHAAFELVVSELAQANTVVIRNFGSFEVKEAKAKIGRNPLDPREAGADTGEGGGEVQAREGR